MLLYTILHILSDIITYYIKYNCVLYQDLKLILKWMQIILHHGIGENKQNTSRKYHGGHVISLKPFVVDVIWFNLGSRVQLQWPPRVADAQKS